MHVAPDGTTTSVVVSAETLSAFTGMIGVAPLETRGPLVDVFDDNVDRYDRPMVGHQHNTYAQPLLCLSFGWHQFVQDVAAPGFTLRIFDSVLAVHSAVDAVADWNTLTLAQQRL